MNTSWR